MMIEFVHVGLNAREGPLQATEINTKNLLIKSIKNSSIIRIFDMNELVTELIGQILVRDLSFDQFHNNNCNFSIFLISRSLIVTIIHPYFRNQHIHSTSQRMHHVAIKLVLYRQAILT